MATISVVSKTVKLKQRKSWLELFEKAQNNEIFCLLLKQKLWEDTHALIKQKQLTHRDICSCSLKQFVKPFWYASTSKAFNF